MPVGVSRSSGFQICDILDLNDQAKTAHSNSEPPHSKFNLFDFVNFDQIVFSSQRLQKKGFSHCRSSSDGFARSWPSCRIQPPHRCQPSGPTSSPGCRPLFGSLFGQPTRSSSRPLAMVETRTSQAR